MRQDDKPSVSYPFALAPVLAILVCRGLKAPIADIWPRLKHYI